jgi:hypothetical protein
MPMQDQGGRVVDGESVSVELSRDDFGLVLTALRLLLSTLGREEADELEQVRALIARLEAMPRRPAA